MALVIAWTLVGILVALMLFETSRYRRARLDAEEVPYPRKRLIRRYTIALLFIATLLLAGYLPAHGTRKLYLTLLSLIVVCPLASILLLLRDLLETSRAVVAHVRRLEGGGEEDLNEILDHMVSGENEQEKQK